MSITVHVILSCVILFVLLQFIRRTCKEITGLVKDGAIAISLIKV